MSQITEILEQIKKATVTVELKDESFYGLTEIECKDFTIEYYLKVTATGGKIYTATWDSPAEQDDIIHHIEILDVTVYDSDGDNIAMETEDIKLIEKEIEFNLQF